MVPKKRESKRKTTRLRTKIDKKVREHNRKVRKEARDAPRRRSKKDPGIPNSFPFKEKLLQDLQQQHQADKKPRRLEALVAQTQQKNEEFEAQSTPEQSLDHNLQPTGQPQQIKDGSRKAFYREFQKVIEQADVVVQVLDARDPLGCRDASLERAVLERGKKLVLLLNKVDLIPKENAQQWIKYLKLHYPTIPFKSSSQRAAHMSAVSEGGCFGVQDVMSLLKNYCRSCSTSQLKTSITVGVVGMPNVGKSSFINALKRGKVVCPVGAQAGVTRTVQLVSLDKTIRLLDSPGIVWKSISGVEGEADDHLLLGNVQSIDHLQDVLAVAKAIWKRSNVAQLCTVYNLQPEEVDSLEQLLLRIAQASGLLRRGGVVDLEAAARKVIADWNAGKIPYFSIPPSGRENETCELLEGEMAEAFQLMEE